MLVCFAKLPIGPNMPALTLRALCQWGILDSGSADVMGHNCERVWEGPPSGNGKIFSKQDPKQGLLAHSEQIVKCGGGHWITPLCLRLYIGNPQAELKTGSSNTIIA